MTQELDQAAIDQPLVSLCMIARDNEQIIYQAIQSASPFVDEIIVVDTGSTDRTPEIATSLGAHVAHFPWCDDFSAARNRSLELANGRWVFWMDTDDSLPLHCGEQLRSLLMNDIPEDVFGFIMQVHCPSDASSQHTFDNHDGKNRSLQATSTVVDHVKLLRNHPELRFEGRIHEQILPAIRRLGGRVSWTDIYVTHSGADYSPEGTMRKLQRDLRLLRMDLKDRPHHPFVRFNLGMTLLHQGEYSKARMHLERCLELSTTDESHLRKTYVLLSDALENLGLFLDARRRCWEGLGRFPDDPELAFKLGRLLMLENRWCEAVEAFHRIWKTANEQRYFASIDPGIKGYKAQANLALCHSELNEPYAAIEAWRKCLMDAPDFLDAWDGIIEICREMNDYRPLKGVAKDFKDIAAAQGPVAVCEALVLDAQGKDSEAHERFKVAVDSGECDGFTLNSYARYLNECREWEKSIPVLQRLRDLESANPSPHLNLGICLLELGRPHEAVESLQTSEALRPGHKQTVQLIRQCEAAMNGA